MEWYCPSRNGSFVALVGDGCLAGPPHYGLAPLSQAGQCGLARLSRPFPLTSPWIWESGDAPPVPGIIREQVWDGALFLGDDGCASFWALILTGAHRGHIWNITDVGPQPIGRSFGHTTAADGFTGWVTHWAGGRDWYDG